MIIDREGIKDASKYKDEIFEITPKMIFKAIFLILVISTAAMEAQQKRESEFALLDWPNYGP